MNSSMNIYFLCHETTQHSAKLPMFRHLKIYTACCVVNVLLEEVDNLCSWPHVKEKILDHSVKNLAK
jgi:hypothetical protein